MGKFNRDDRGDRRDRGDRGGFGGKKKFGGDRGGFGRGDRERPAMHQAVCDECGRDCEVPFRPSGDKPVYCSTCFGNKEDGGGRSERRSNDRSSSFGEKQMFEAVCSDCGKDCEVPFRPTSEKPVYCSDCFGKTERGDRGAGRSNAGGSDQYKKQFEMLNNKMDSILKLLSANSSTKTSSEKTVKEEKPVVKEEKKVAEKKVEKKKEVAKEVVAKKVVAKKEVAVKKEVKKAVAKKKK